MRILANWWSLLNDYHQYESFLGLELLCIGVLSGKRFSKNIGFLMKTRKKAECAHLFVQIRLICSFCTAMEVRRKLHSPGLGISSKKVIRFFWEFCFFHSFILKTHWAFFRQDFAMFTDFLLPLVDHYWCCEILSQAFLLKLWALWLAGW